MPMSTHPERTDKGEDSMLVHNEDDFKYVMQDIEKYYIGARYTYEELMGLSIIPFKLKTVIERYLVHDIDRTTSLESCFYYMGKEDADYRVYRQLRTRVRCTMLQKPHAEDREDRYMEKVMTVDQLARISQEDKKAKNLVIREIGISKLGLMMFQV